MRLDRALVPAAVLLVAAAAGGLLLHRPRAAGVPADGPREKSEAGKVPNEWFMAQRAFPFETVPQEKWIAAYDQARADRARAARGRGNGTLAGPAWVQAGPFNIGGRVTAVVAAPGGNPAYFGAAGGGVFKSTNSGVNWTPVFDEMGVFSIGALAMHPTDANTVYVGTGEANSSVDSYDGAGVFRTTDGGASWTSLGLAETRRIARIAVDPVNPQRLFVAAMGTQFSTSPDRGLYRSEDGGANWTKVLFVNDSTGVCDVVINPAHPETMFCATWERVRRSTYRRAYGPGGGVWRSVNGGTTWTKLAGGLPASDDNLGRIGLAIAKSQPSVVYAQIISGAIGGYTGRALYRTADGGNVWGPRGGSTFTNNFGGFGWYFGDVAVSPTDPNRVYVQGVGLLRSLDGGTTLTSIQSGTHVDHHGVWIDPSNQNRVYLGNDGGFFSSLNGGVGWTQSLDTPITQFYAGSVDPSNPDRLLGGTQDNSTMITTGSPSGWTIILGGDGFQTIVSPADPNVIYAEWQYCCDRSGLRRSINGGSSWITPSGFSSGDRYNWNTPIAMNPANPAILLVGSHRVYKSTNSGSSYVPVSGDLSGAPPSSLVYGTLTTLSISPADTALYYAGTDDGRVWRSQNAGGTWENVSAGLPLRYVTRVTPDPSDPNAVYVTLSGFGQDEHLSHVYRSANRGTSWTSISANLPDVPANDIVVDPTDTQSLYLATDVGVYASRNQGAGWFPLGTGMPVQTVFDLSLYSAGGTRRLIAATHGRSQWTLDLTQLPLDVPAPPSAVRLELSAPAPNPSRGQVRLTLELPAPSAVEAAIYDLSGRRVAGLASGRLAAGRHVLEWDGRSSRGDRVPAGVYFARVSSGLETRTRTVVRGN